MEGGMEAGEQLREENERLVGEMATMKKKIKLALKKQQAEMQARIQALEQRALAAEAAVAADGDGGALSRANSEIVEPDSPASGANGSLLSVSSSLSHPLSLAGSNGGITHSPSPDTGDDLVHTQASVESLLAELKTERQSSMGQEADAFKERQRLENEVIELTKSKDTLIKEGEEAGAKFDEKLRLVKENAEERVAQLTKANEELEAQLMSAAGQVAEAFARMSSTHHDMERISGECQETKCAHSNLVTDHESVCRELEQSRSTLAEAQQKLQDKVKEMEEMAAARKAAQEGQEAAMSQLMHRLDEHLRELNEDRVLSLLQEKVDLEKELERSSDAISILQEEITSYKHRLLTVEATAANVDTRDNLDVEMTISGLKAHNESLLEELRSQAAGVIPPQQELDKLAGLHETPASIVELSSLREQLEIMGASQQAAENQIKRLSVACSDGEQQVDKLSQELAIAQRNLDDEIKLRDDKYTELDAKFGRLQKRAKQRIQEVQKEKEDAEAQVAVSGEKAAQALSKQAALQDDLERVRFQAGEARRTLDAERQQLRAANIKLRDEVQDLGRSLEGKEHNLAESRRLASEKDQTALELTTMLKEAEANHDAAMSDIKDKARKAEDNLKAQLADAMSERSKMAETISALQAEVGIKESKLAELEAVSSGETVRLGASLEAAKGEVYRLELEHKKEQEIWQASSEKLRKRLEDSEKETCQQESAVAELRSQMESELERHRQVLGNAQADLSAARNETARIASELAAYKVRAIAVFQQKDAALLAAKDSQLAAAQETAVKNAKREASLAALERDRALKSLQHAVSEYENKLSARDISVLDAEQRIRDLATKLEASKGQMLAERDDWQSREQQMEAMWRLKYDTLEAKIKGSVEDGLKLEYSALLNVYNNLKDEFDSFRDLVDTMIEEKDKEIARLLEENAISERPPFSLSRVQSEAQIIHAPEQPEADLALGAGAEQQILLLARQQAQREEEISQSRRHIQALQEEIADLEQENRLHSQQEALLKEELRNAERSQKRDGVDMTYLKNVILKLLETGEVEALLPVVGMLLQFSPEELKRCHETYDSSTTNTPLSGAAAVVDSAVSTPRSFLSRLAFPGGN